ncbi:hypothetical protein NDU88_004253 [Pleurodeles waltl]|uniref:Uncharacterized protein n=1 Tax=Pleurodeles waltl TaxID=8319 RepID=A0AAV7M7V2_PLEWA|nr:hypothetical protein NDU88_004253 [Pleurodeles waltl]
MEGAGGNLHSDCVRRQASRWANGLMSSGRVLGNATNDLTAQLNVCSVAKAPAAPAVPRHSLFQFASRPRQQLLQHFSCASSHSLRLVSLPGATQHYRPQRLQIVQSTPEEFWKGKPKSRRIVNKTPHFTRLDAFSALSIIRATSV